MSRATLGWSQLGWLEMEKFPQSKGARLLPCYRLKPLGPDVPLVQTPRGEARLLSVGETTADVVIESHLQVYRNRMAALERGQERPSEPRLVTFPLHQVHYPTAPPPEWQLDLAWHEMMMIAAARKIGRPVSEFAKSLTVCLVLFHGLFALGCWLFPGGGV